MGTIKPFDYLVFITRHINFSVDLIQHHRFIEERRRERRADRYSNPSNSSTTHHSNRFAHLKEPWWNPKKYSMFIHQILVHNQVGLPHLLMLIMHPTLLIILTVSSTLYSMYPLTRDPATAELTHHIPRFLESNIHVNFLNLIGQPHMFNRLLAVITLQFLCIRLRAIYIIVKNARINWHRYSRLNIVQFEFGYADNLEVDSSNWFKLARNFCGHKCNLETTLTGKRGRLIRNLVSKVNCLSKLDRLYFFNQIDFASCFSSAGLVCPCDNPETSKKTSSARESDTIKEERKSPPVWFGRFLHFKAKGDRCFRQSMPHRIDPKHALQFWVMMCVSSFGVIFFLTLINFGYAWMGLNEVSGLRCPGTMSLLERLVACPKILVGSIEGALINTMLAVNAYDNALMAYTAVVCYSRSNKVIRMLDRELMYHRMLLKSFCRFIDSKGLDIDVYSRSSVVHQNNHAQSRHWSGVRPLSLDTNGMKKTSIPSSKTRSFSRSSLSTNNEPYEDQFHTSLHEYRDHVNVNRLIEFNANINCLIDLTNVLEKELDDLKEFFTNYLNINFIFGIIGSSMAMTIVLGSESSNEILVGIPLGLASFVPMIYALLLGATSESSFRRIYRTLVPLMINELNLVEPYIIYRLQRLCNHLAVIRNRSFIIIGNFPLTFGSLTSIFAWIATGNLLIQRFLLQKSTDTREE